MRCRRWLLALAVALAILPAPAQEAPPELAAPPVRYDPDHLPASFHQDRRAQVKAALPEGALAFVFSAPIRPRENDVDFEYRQNSDLYYLTGTTEPASVLLLAPGGVPVDGATVTEVLFVPPRTEYSDVWLGRRFGAERAAQELGVERALSNERFAEIVQPLLADEARPVLLAALPTGVAEGSDLAAQIGVVTAARPPLQLEGNWRVRPFLAALLGLDEAGQFEAVQGRVRGVVDPSALEQPALRAAAEAFLAADSFEAWQAWKQDKLAAYADVMRLDAVLSDLRAVKTPEEIALLQRAIDITAAAHREAMRSIEPGMHEYEVEALVEYVFKRNGAEDPGFPSIVASGENSTILHYNTNRRRMAAEDVVVIDIGAEVRGYTADVTRTVPVDGTFSEEQRAIYELVLAAQQAGIEAARAGHSFRDPGTAAQRVIAQGLKDLGLIQTEEDVRNFFMHGTSHYLGLWVHDVGPYGELQPGMVITVEPGIYISPSPEVDPRWWHIGVRIEDDVLITAGDPVVMSTSAPRTVADVEALMRERGLGNDPAGVVE